MSRVARLFGEGAKVMHQKCGHTEVTSPLHSSQKRGISVLLGSRYSESDRETRRYISAVQRQRHPSSSSSKERRHNLLVQSAQLCLGGFRRITKCSSGQRSCFPQVSVGFHRRRVLGDDNWHALSPCGRVRADDLCSRRENLCGCERQTWPPPRACPGEQ